MEILTVSDNGAHRGYITHLYNRLIGTVLRGGGEAKLHFSDRNELEMRLPNEYPELKAKIVDEISDVVGIGYKYEFLKGVLDVCLGAREKKLLSAALIAADFEGDANYIRKKTPKNNEYAIDGIYNFRLAPLREKWEKIVGYIPRGFSGEDLSRFCEFLVGESRRKVYLRDGALFSEDYKPLRRSRLMGTEDIASEILLSDAGFVYCLGDVSDEVADFLQKYYAERTIFS